MKNGATGLWIGLRDDPMSVSAKLKSSPGSRRIGNLTGFPDQHPYPLKLLRERRLISGRDRLFFRV